MKFMFLALGLLLIAVAFFFIEMSISKPDNVVKLAGGFINGLSIAGGFCFLASAIAHLADALPAKGN